MGDFARKSDGRRIFTVEFKRGIVQQLVKGEKTRAEVSQELDQERQLFTLASARASLARPPLEPCRFSVPTLLANRSTRAVWPPTGSGPHC
jgi:transposase-like protein